MLACLELSLTEFACNTYEKVLVQTRFFQYAINCASEILLRVLTDSFYGLSSSFLLN
jgi:hypothetical protein